MVMIFGHPKVREYLLEHGLVYTYRKNHKKTADGIRPQTGRDWATDRRLGKKIADIYITPVEHIDCPINTNLLRKYARESGFYTGEAPYGSFYTGLGPIDLAVSEWSIAIKSLNPKSPSNGWIYRVEVIGADS